VAGILTFTYTRDLTFGWVSGVLSFRDEEAGLGLDIVFGCNPGRVIDDYTRSFPESWYHVSRVDHSSRNLSNSDNAQPLASPIHSDAQPRNFQTRSDARLSYVFKTAERESSCEWYSSPYTYRSVLSTPWIEPLEAKVTFERTEFLGHQGFAVQVEIS